jgi:DNA-binding phage protein
VAEEVEKYELRLPYHTTITDMRIDLMKLSDEECGVLVRAWRLFCSRLEWTKFSQWCNEQTSKTGSNISTTLRCVLQDLESRLGIAQDKLAPPDYCDYIMERIDHRFGSCSKFCQAVGLDEHQVVRVLSGASDLPINALLSIADHLGVRLIVQDMEND